MKKIYFSPLIRETVVGVEVGFCGSGMSSDTSVYVEFSKDSTFGTMDGE